MKFPPLLTFCLSIMLSPAGLAASREDAAAEAAARASYNFHVILEDRVQVTVESGIATLTGKTPDRDLRALASDTLRAIPNIDAVNNLVILDTLVPEYSDAWTAIKVRQRLLMKAGVNVTRIKVEVSNQVATLAGFVENEEQKRLAGKYAGEMAAIRLVKNELKVETGVPAETNSAFRMDDASVSTLVKHALGSERLLTASRTKITSINGVVSISGEAESDAERDRVATLAATVRGVISVSNQVAVRR